MDRIEKSYHIAITGIVGSGKTTVSQYLRERGFSVFDTDEFSRQIIAENKSIAGVLENIIKQPISHKGRLNLKKVGKVFDDNPQLEKEFEEWYQVYLADKIIQIKSSFMDQEEILFFDIPKLSQKKMEYDFDILWILEVEEATVFKRIKKRNDYSNTKIMWLIDNSKTNKESLAADYICIDNNGTTEELQNHIDEELDKLRLLLSKTPITHI